MTRTCGSTATGIRWTAIITGTEAIGRFRRMTARYGSCRIMKRAATTAATGEARGRFEHDHHWDHDRDRDHGRWHEDNGKHKGWYKKHRDDDRD